MRRNVVKNKSGIILITVLWIVAILSLLALSLSKGSSLDLLLMRNSVGQLKAYAAARAGINYAQGLLAKKRSETDTLYQNGIKIPEGKGPQDLFKQIPVGKGAHFDIVIPGESYNLVGSEPYGYGLEDEQGRININAIDTSNYKVIVEFLEGFGINDSDAESMAASIADWHSDSSAPFKVQDSTAIGAKDEFYSQLPIPYKCKNRPFDRIEELMLVKGITKEIFTKIKSFLTVYPQNPAQDFKINFKTAPDRVIRAVVKAYSVGLSSDDTAQSFIDKRNGPDKIPFTVDDWNQDRMNASASNQLLMNALEANQGVSNSEFFRINSVGTDEATGIKCRITAVVNNQQGQSDISLVSWYRE